MGYSRWDDNSWQDYSRVTKAATSREQIFKQTFIKEAYDPAKVVIRESRDSEKNPNSTPIIVGLDVTGSMGIIAEVMAKDGLGELVNGILDRVPVSDPHIMVMGIGDQGDRAPLQATQFEADIRIAEQLSDIWLEGNGGGNGSEAYDIPWIFAARKTVTDSMIKRGKKGYLFTIGDENPPPNGVSEANYQRVFGKSEQKGGVALKDSLAEAQESYDVFHIIVEQGDYCRRDIKGVTSKWRNLLDRRAISLNDYTKVAPVILSVIEVAEGRNPEDVVRSWEDKDTRKAVRYSLGL